ncbi:UBX domain-containing protein 10 [Trichomycterus rosablanca]|uniref:UBX domain-containing protein 10 n=1 Tax=Trichomycterus rosablanca TaxID=2290929 RepID=UPI002F35B92A
MHVIRPKSAKGRTRPRATQVQDDEHAHQKPTFPPHPPHPPPGPRPLSTISQRSNLLLRPCSVRHNITENSEMFEKSLDAPVLPLNRYQVLPSIEKKPEKQSNRCLEEKTLRLNRSDNSSLGAHTSRLFPKPTSRSGLQFQNESRERCGPAEPVKTSHSGCQKREADLLLAVRTPCGQRFKCYFHSTDTLQTVIDAAEAKYGKQYRHTLIETMDVPRRSFTNLTMTFSQCDIINKSVLCISFKDAD